MKQIYIIWIWWIWISAIARYYNENWYRVFGSDKTDSELIHTMGKEWIDIFIWERSKSFLSRLSFEKIIYTEAIPKNQSELSEFINLWCKVITYPESLAEIANQKKLIWVSWTHWKSTTTSLISIMLKNSPLKVNAVIWSLLKEFDGKNSFFSESEYFVIEACEYKRSFLHYKPYIWIITNIDLDHLDYYKDLNDYNSAFYEYMNNIITWWYLIIDWNCKNSRLLVGKRLDINYILVFNDYFEIIYSSKSIDKPFLWNKIKDTFPILNLKIPWKHIEFDAKIAYVVWSILWLDKKEIVISLKDYDGIWRRSEMIWYTLNHNMLMSDYWHHPTEISLNLEALKNKYKDKQIVTIFQPHQYNRTLELLEDFKNCFKNTDILIVPNIYNSRDTKEDMEKIDGSKFISYINHPNKIWWDWFENTLKIINDLDIKKPNKLLFILQWAWDIDNLRYDIKIIK